MFLTHTRITNVNIIGSSMRFQTLMKLTFTHFFPHVNYISLTVVEGYVPTSYIKRFTVRHDSEMSESEAPVEDATPRTRKKLSVETNLSVGDSLIGETADGNVLLLLSSDGVFFSI